MQKFVHTRRAGIFVNRRPIWLNRAPLYASPRATAGGVVYVNLRVLFRVPPTRAEADIIGR